jgi:hypothetical protein
MNNNFPVGTLIYYQPPYQCRSKTKFFMAVLIAVGIVSYEKKVMRVMLILPLAKY